MHSDDKQIRPSVFYILHHPWDSIEGQREAFLVERLKQKLDLHVLTWTSNKGRSRLYFFSPFYYIKSLRAWSKQEDRFRLHHLPSVPNITNFFARYKFSSFFVNRWLYRYYVKKICKKFQIKVIVCAINHWYFGRHYKIAGVRNIFDYLDAYDEFILRPILNDYDHILCVSNFLVQQASRYHPSVSYSPNGVDLTRFKSLKSDEEKEHLKESMGLAGRTIISLIGLTCSHVFYFVDAIKMLAKEDSSIIFLFVGGGMMERALRQYCDQIGVQYLATGFVVYEEIQKYYDITDVGLYPGDESIVYDGACPLKVLEYTASKKPLVVSSSWELAQLGFPNMFITPPNAKAFAEAIKRALSYKGDYPEMKNFDWDHIAYDMYKRILEQCL